MPTPIRFADDGGTAAWRARHDPPAAPHFPIWRFLLVVAALPLLLAFMAATSWLAWICFQDITGTPGDILALTAIAALAALIRRHTGTDLGAALTDTRRYGGVGRAGVGCVRTAGIGSVYG